MLKKYFYLVFLLLFSVLSVAAPLKKYFFKGDCENLTNYFQYLEDCNGLGLTGVHNHFYNKDFQTPLQNTTFNKGFSQCSYWLVVNVENATGFRQKMIWSFYNNGLEFSFYELRNNQLVFIDKSSMHESLQKRPYPVRSVSFPFFLDVNQSKTLFVKVTTTIHANVYFPTDITNVEDYLWYEIDFSYLMGKYFGIFFLAFFVNFCMFSIIKERIYLYNSLYILLIILFQLSDFHIDSLQIPDDCFYGWSYINKSFFISLGLFFYLKVFQIFTNQKVEQPIIYKILNIYINVLLIGICLDFTSTLFILKYITIRSFLNIIIYAFNSFGFIILVCSMIMGVMEYKRYFILFMASSFVLLYGFMTYILNTLNIANLPIFQPGNIINGMAIEISLLTVFFVYKYKIEREEATKQIINKIKINESLTLKLVEAQELERKIIAENLHDEIGSNLTGLRLQLENSFATSNISKEYQENILINFKNIYQKVRNISHQLKPKELENNSFVEVISEQIIFYGNNFKTVKFEFNTNLDTNFLLATTIENHLYRIILSLLSNVVQHAQATKIVLQIDKSNQQLLIILEDDGIGFDTQINPKGIGLKNIKSRVDYLKGTFVIDSNKMGSTFIIEIPI